ncbi:DUF1800 family protein [Photobacterium aphoticum]|uniref:DUF1800 domain-containing protein n=1 Tax=Photobacterium aphoticum TaxID=754436 RepID=A0A0J1GFV5_9GAMM|nr:DUF1800 domain-containing protein [Photobacterium aphoticum]KLU98592.1 hypothetical protein ABT58_21660 [Photobacterium aphoticum]
MTSLIQDKDQAARFIYRATFGPKPGDVDRLVNMGESAWFEEQFNLPRVSQRQLTERFSYASGDNINEVSRMSAWWNCVIEGDDQLRQRMAYALSQVVVVSRFGGPDPQALSEYYDLLLDHAFGNYRDLLKAVTLSPAMGRYLTLEGSRKANPRLNSFPDENYAREVMQLFSMGLWRLDDDGIASLDGNGNRIPNYTQEDVEELARVLTGWRRRTYFQPMYSVANRHDFDQKVVLGQVFPAGQTPEQDVDQAIDMLFEHRNTPIFISKLLIQRLTISNPRREYVRRVAKVFKNNGQGERGDLKAVLKAILLDPDVLAGRAMADYQQTGNGARNFGKVKEPVIAMANLVRALQLKNNDPARWWDFPGTQGNFGQAPLQATSVFNFYEPDYAPKGELTDKQLYGPEFAILSMDVVRRISNRMWAAVVAGNETAKKRWSWDRTEFRNTVADHEAYITLVNERVFAGLMSAKLADFLRKMLAELTAKRYGPDRQVLDTLFAVQCSPEFRCQE